MLRRYYRMQADLIRVRPKLMPHHNQARAGIWVGAMVGNTRRIGTDLSPNGDVGRRLAGRLEHVAHHDAEHRRGAVPYHVHHLAAMISVCHCDADCEMTTQIVQHCVALGNCDDHAEAQAEAPILTRGNTWRRDGLEREMLTRQYMVQWSAICCAAGLPSTSAPSASSCPNRSNASCDNSYNSSASAQTDRSPGTELATVLLVPPALAQGVISASVGTGSHRMARARA